MASGSGISGLMFVLRGTAERVSRGEGPPLSVMYHPESLRAARRRLLLVWLLVVAIPPVAVVVAGATLIEPAWIGSPVRAWVALSIPVAVLWFVGAAVVLS